jgi:hypothetical protein
MDINLNELLFLKLKPVELLTDEKKALWGKMNAQQMVEHLIDFLEMSNGRIEAELITPFKKIESVKKSLLSNRPLAEIIELDLFPHEPKPFKTNNMFFAKQTLYEEVIEFYKFFDITSYAAPMHPIFGRLSKKEWEIFHVKHFNHHFSQFGLI